MPFIVGLEAAASVEWLGVLITPDVVTQCCEGLGKLTELKLVAPMS
jgi:hypothetical protein